MSAERTSGLLLRLYPPEWRARYGKELEALIVEASDGRVSMRVRADVARAAVRERVRALGLSGDAPRPAQARGGALLVLCAWALFVVAGTAVQKFSEHWQAVTPSDSRGLPTTAFSALVIAAAVGSTLVLVALVAVLPSVVQFLRTGGWQHVRRTTLVAVGLTIAALAGSAAVIVWAHSLSSAERNGDNGAYAAGVTCWAVLLIACVASWTTVAVAVGRRLELSSRMLRLDALLAAAVTVAMAVMTAATAVWWASLASSAPWFLAGQPSGTTGSAFAPTLTVATSLMLVATLVAALGAYRAVRAVVTGDEHVG